MARLPGSSLIWGSASRNRAANDHTAEKIDDEVMRLIKVSEHRAIELQKGHREQLDLLASALVEKESLDEDEIDAVLG